MRRAALLFLPLVLAGCHTARVPRDTTPRGVGVLVQGATGRCAPVQVGSVVRRVCLPPSGPGAEKPDSAKADSAVVTR